jgi:hypothetical protein
LSRSYNLPAIFCAYTDSLDEQSIRFLSRGWVGDAEILDCVSLLFPQWKYSAYTLGGESLKYKGLHTYSRVYAAVAALHTYAELAARSRHAPVLSKNNGGLAQKKWRNIRKGI